MNTGPYGQYQANMGTHAPDQAVLIMQTIPIVGDPNGQITTTTIPAFAYDTSGNTLYATTDGSTWTAVSGGGGGGGIKQVYMGHGSPAGVVSASATGTQGIIYYDLDSGIIYEKNGTGTSGWF